MRTATRKLLLPLLIAIAALAAGLTLASAPTPPPQITAFFMKCRRARPAGTPTSTSSRRWTRASPCPTHRLHLRGHERSAHSHFPTGLHRQPARPAGVHAARFRLANCPIDSQVGVASALRRPAADLQHGAASERGRPDRLQRPADRSPRLRRAQRPDRQRLRPRQRTAGVFHFVALTILQLHLWGVPADPKHDINRFPAPQGGNTCFVPYPEQCNQAQPFNSPIRPYLQNPTACGGFLTLEMEALFYDNNVDHAEPPGRRRPAATSSSFNPSLTAEPTTTQADSPSGLDVDLKVPQTQSPSAPSPSEIRAATVTFPEGFSINPNAADGKTSCTDAQAAFGTTDEAQCPEHSKVGTVSIDSSALPAPIAGAIYLGEPLPGDNVPAVPDRRRLRDPREARRAPSRLDPATGPAGGLLPQPPADALPGVRHALLRLRARAARDADRVRHLPRADRPSFPGTTVLPNQTSTSFFTVDRGPNGSPCPSSAAPVHPEARAGSADNTAGAYSPFGSKSSATTATRT